MSNLIYPVSIKGLTPQVLKSATFATIEQKAASGFAVNIPQQKNPIWTFQLIYDYVYGTFRSPNNTQAYAPYTDIDYLTGFFLAMSGKADDFLFPDPLDYSAAGLRSGTWQQGHSYALGTAIIDRSGHAQVVTTAGTSGTSFPLNFSTTGGTTTDGSVVWTDKGFSPDGWPDGRVTLPVVADTLTTPGSTTYYSPLQRTMGGLYLEDITDLQPSGGADTSTLQVYANGALQVAGGDYTIVGPGYAIPGYSWAGLVLKWTAQPAAPVTANFRFFYRMKFAEDTQDFERWCKYLWTIGGSTAKSGAGYIKLVTSRVSRV